MREFGNTRRTGDKRYSNASQFCAKQIWKKFGGIVDEIIEKTIELSEKYALPDKKGNFYNRIACPEILSYVMLKMCVEAGVKIMFHAELVGIKRKDKKSNAHMYLPKADFFRLMPINL